MFSVFIIFYYDFSFYDEYLKENGKFLAKYIKKHILQSGHWSVRCLFFYDFFICSDILTEGSRHYSKTFDTIWDVNKPIPVVRYCLG